MRTHAPRFEASTLLAYEIFGYRNHAAWIGNYHGSEGITPEMFMKARFHDHGLSTQNAACWVV